MDYPTSGKKRKGMLDHQKTRLVRSVCELDEFGVVCCKTLTLLQAICIAYPCALLQVPSVLTSSGSLQLLCQKPNIYLIILSVIFFPNYGKGGYWGKECQAFLLYHHYLSVNNINHCGSTCAMHTSRRAASETFGATTSPGRSPLNSSPTFKNRPFICVQRPIGMWFLHAAAAAIGNS